MRGIFQNCELIESLELTKFYTPNVIIMWDMFKGCSSLINLNIPHFDTSKVTDMQSMFSGCKSLISLNLNHFNTTLVQYMNEMFQDCESLKYLSMSQLISDSLGTMYRMFYGCRSLEYLNLFPLIENVESINEMFSGTSDNFIICINDKANIPNIFEIIKNKNITRDCSDNCYGPGKGRYSTIDPIRCCPLYYNGNCYYECPGKT
jgi:surface protein